MIAANLTLLFCLYVAFSSLGKVCLGGADAKPEYSNASWFAMLFAAGVGIALIRSPSSQVCSGLRPRSA